MPTGGDGSSISKWSELQDKWKIYERFVSNFYSAHLAKDEWNVCPQRQLNWNQPSLTRLDRQGDLSLPAMRPDIELVHKLSEQRIIIDTKWYKKVAFTHFGSENVHSGNLYQMYAYLASQAHFGGSHQASSGVLLYAQTKEGARRLRTRIDHHPFWVHTLDLSRPWRQIHEELLKMIQEARDTFAHDGMAVASA